MPTSNTAFWRSKLRRNMARDAEHLVTLKRLGWKALVVWECRTRNTASLSRRLTNFLK
jgi:DNA mismatch endonuclease (patch repair protein)